MIQFKDLEKAIVNQLREDLDVILFFIHLTAALLGVAALWVWGGSF